MNIITPYISQAMNLTYQYLPNLNNLHVNCISQDSTKFFGYACATSIIAGLGLLYYGISQCPSNYKTAGVSFLASALCFHTAFYNYMFLGGISEVTFNSTILKN